MGWWAAAYPGLELTSYSLLFFLGFGVGLIGLYYVLRVPEPRMGPRVGTDRFRAVIAEPFRDPNFRRLMAFIGTWNFALTLAAPFFTVYLLVRLGYGIPIVIGLAVLSQVANAIVAGSWGRLTDAFSNKAVLAVSRPLVLVSLLLWLFTALPERHSLTLPLLVVIHILLGVAMSGVGLATSNIGMKLPPKGRATAYLAATSLIGSLATGIGPLVGGAVASGLEGYHLSTTLELTTPRMVREIPTLDLVGIDFAFVLAFVIGLYGMHRLSAVAEGGEIDRTAVAFRLVDDVRRPLVNFSTIGGLSQLVTFPVSAARELMNSERDGRPPREAEDEGDHEESRTID